MEKYDKNLLTIAMSVYNPNVKWFKQCVYSILSQTYDNFELIIVNDASTNKTAFNFLVDLDDRIKLIVKDKNEGCIKGYITAHETGTGYWRTTVDCDDWFAPNCFQLHIDSMKQAKVNWSYSNGWNYYENTKKLTPWTCPKFNRRFLIKQNFICAIGVMWTADLYDDVGGYDSELLACAQDYDLWIKFAEKGLPILLLPRLFIYRWHGNNLSKSQGMEEKYKIAHKMIYDNMNKRIGKTRKELLSIDPIV